jgi:hypothetical protein
MLYSGVSKVVGVPAENIEITDQIKDSFIAAVLSNKPFTFTDTIGDLVIKFCTPTLKEYEQLSQLDDTTDPTYEDGLIVSCIKSIFKNNDVVYNKSDKSLLDRKAELSAIFSDTVVLPILIGKWFRFFKLYKTLCKEAVSPDFFEKTRNTG